jgi:hypothetical protein
MALTLSSVAVGSTDLRTNCSLDGAVAVARIGFKDYED